MRIYIAASFANRERARDIRFDLSLLGIQSTATWIDTHLTEMEALTPERKGREALDDFYDIERSHGLLCIHDPAVPSTSGGYYFEMGYALAIGLPVWLLGPQTSVFHFHPRVRQIETLDEITAPEAGTEPSGLSNPS